MLEQNIKDILNAGIGLFKSGEENLQSTIQAVQAAFEDLKTRGAADSSEASQKIREVLDNSIKGFQDISTQTEENMNRVLQEAQKSYSQVLDQVKQVIGDERIQDLNDRFEDLAGFVKNKANDMAQAANSFADTVKEKAEDVVETAKDVASKATSSVGKKDNKPDTV